MAAKDVHRHQPGNHEKCSTRKRNGLTARNAWERRHLAGAILFPGGSPAPDTPRTRNETLAHVRQSFVNKSQQIQL
jgi:hypothetical protein